MSKKLGIRAARKAAMNMAAAMVRDADFDSLYGGLAWTDGDEEVLERAQKEVANRLQRLADGAAHDR